MSIDPFEVTATHIDGLHVLRPKTVSDDRGAVRELFRTSAFAEAGLPAGPWLQLNATESRPGTIRGMHGEPMTKLVGVVAGEAFGAYVDARRDSPTCGRVVTVELRPGVQVLVPPGVCNGFQTVGDRSSQYVYCFDSEWEPGMGGVAVHPLDPELAIPWPVLIDPDDRSVLSAKDAGQPSLRHVLGSDRV